jgi:hypothetical protein
MTANRFSKSELFAAYNQARAFARKHHDQVDEPRLDRALGIIQTREYYTGDRAEYGPTVHACGCKDWEFHNARRRGYTGPCKHMLAEAILNELAQRQAVAIDAAIAVLTMQEA